MRWSVLEAGFLIKGDLLLYFLRLIVHFPLHFLIKIILRIDELLLRVVIVVIVSSLVQNRAGRRCRAIFAEDLVTIDVFHHFVEIPLGWRSSGLGQLALNLFLLEYLFLWLAFKLVCKILE